MVWDDSEVCRVRIKNADGHLQVWYPLLSEAIPEGVMDEAQLFLYRVDPANVDPRKVKHRPASRRRQDPHLFDE